MRHRALRGRRRRRDLARRKADAANAKPWRATRVVYSDDCTYWQVVDAVDVAANGRCPECRARLSSTTEENWLAVHQAAEAATPGWLDTVRSLRGRCQPVPNEGPPAA